jgi:hypothetical protein
LEFFFTTNILTLSGRFGQAELVNEQGQWMEIMTPQPRANTTIALIPGSSPIVR